MSNIIVHKQDKQKNNAKQSIRLILDNLRSAYNVGSIIRTAECLNIEEIYFCGYTATPDHPKIAKTAMGTEERITWKHFAKTEDAILHVKSCGYFVYALETVVDSVSVFDENFKEKTAIVVGNEALGISENVLSLSDRCLSLPVTPQ